MTKILLIGQVDQEQIDKWKKLYGDIHSITVDGHIGYIKPFDRKTASIALQEVEISKHTTLGEYYRIGQACLTHCWIGGSDEIQKKESLYIAAAVKAGELLDLKEAELKKL